MIVDELGTGRTFRVAALLSIHEHERHELELPDALGDGSLLCRIPPLERARRALMDMAYAFVPGNQMGGNHTMFPLLELTEILRTRTIPYRRSAVAAKQILAHRPDLSLSDSLFRETCTASYCFHEGAHAIFYERACAQEGVPRGRRYVEIMLASEAFAMAFEQFVALLAVVDGRRSTALFLAVSAYANPLDFQCFERDDPGVVARLGRLAVETPEKVMMIMVCAYMVALLRPTAIALPGLAEWLADYADLRDENSKDSKHLVSIGLHVEYEFRDRTQRNFYEHLGLQHELEMVRADPLESFLKRGSPIECFLPLAMNSVMPDRCGAL